MDGRAPAHLPSASIRIGLAAEMTAQPRTDPDRLTAMLEVDHQVSDRIKRRPEPVARDGMHNSRGTHETNPGRA